VNPNPLVGCVIVHDGKIISEGWHKGFGQAHAERMAIDEYLSAGNDAGIFKECEVYVSLEPCSHFGKTPPCADLLVKHQFKRVFVSMLDPNILVAGSGIEKLKQAGISVEVGIGEALARLQNRFFLCYHEKKRPYIILKWAETQDGFIAPESRIRTAISGVDSQKYVHALRQECSAILVGRSTLLGDNPQLTDRYFGGPQPSKFVFSSSWSGDLNDDFQRVENVQQLIQICMEQGLNSVLIEGGLQTLEYFLATGFVDEVHKIQSKTMSLKSGICSPHFESVQLGLEVVSQTENESDFITVFRRKS
jgi:diaminohydroxyphosphoribosylaminopyrimidine deaminase/5-amino-6-(5-phosphoribosylamino)uracil reductase